MQSVSEQILDRIFKNMKMRSENLVDQREFRDRFTKMGIRTDDPRANEIFDKLEDLP